MKPLYRFLHICLFVFVSAGTIFAQVPRTFSYQGSLVDAANRPVTGIHEITVTLYDVESGGTPLHTETFSSQVESGIFNVVLGSVSALEPTLAFDKEYWLGVSVDGGSELNPRTGLTSVLYALHTPIADLASGLTSDAKGIVTSMNEISGALRIIGDSTVTLTQNGQQISFHANPSGVRSLNGLTGQITLLAGMGTSITPGKGTITITAAGGSGGKGIQGVSNSDGTISILNPFGPTATIGLAGVDIASNGQVLTANGSGGASWQNNNQLLSVIADLPLSGSGTAASHLKITNGTTTGNVLTWNGTSWTSAAGGLTSVIANAPITGNGTAVSRLAIAQANTSTNGYLSSTDWTTFNNKLSSVAADLPLTGLGTAANHLKITNGTATGNVLTWSGTAWVSAAPGNSTGGGWSLTGNSGTTAGVNYIGTRDSTAFEIHVYNNNTNTHDGTGRVLRVEPNTGVGSSPNWIAGYHGNYVAWGKVGATIAGGGQYDSASFYHYGWSPDSVIGDFGSIGGGVANTAGDLATVGGGERNKALGPYATVGGGSDNVVRAGSGTIAGGLRNRVDGYGTYQTVGGGGSNFANGDYSVIGGGYLNIVGEDYYVSGDYSVVSGGESNIILGAYSTIAGGALLKLNGDGSFGFNNPLSGRDSAIVNVGGTAYFGNVNLWLGNTSGTASQLRFYEAQSSIGAFPASGTNYTAFKAGAQSADITYTLPSNAPAASGNLLLATTGPASSMSWSTGLVWDNANTRVGIGTSTPRAEIDVNSTGAIIIPVGTTAQRPGTPVQGMIRYNTTTSKFEGFDGAAWQNLN